MSLSSLASKFQQITDLLNSARNVLIATHEYPDADGIGSALAIRRLCDSKGLTSTIYTSGSPPLNLRLFPGVRSISNNVGHLSFDLAFCLDYGDFVRLRLPENLEVKTLITVDHHPLASQRGDVQLVAPWYSSTAEIIYWWFKFAGFQIDKTIATYLLTGIVGDTGGFKHVSTSSGALRATSDLVAKGAPLSKIMRRATSFQGNPAVSKIIGRALSRIVVEPRSSLAYSWVDLDEVKTMEQATFAISELPTIVATASPINFGLFLVQEQENLVRGSFRAEPHSNRDVNVLARILGGGGHKYAAGFRYQGTVKEALKKVLELV